MLYLDIAIVAGETAGLVFSIGKHGWWGQFVYYTQWSNYLLLLTTAVHLFCLLRRKMPGADLHLPPSEAYEVGKARMGADAHAALLAERNGLFHHLLCPILAVASLPFLTRIRKKDSALAMIPTVIYGIVLYTLNYFRMTDGPYPFLRVHEQPWYMSVVWFVALAAAAYGIATGLRRLCGRKREREV